VLDERGFCEFVKRAKAERMMRLHRLDVKTIFAFDRKNDED